MTDWIKAKVEEIRNEHAAQEGAREWELHENKMVRAEADRLWMALVKEVERQVQAFNQEFPTRKPHLEFSEGSRMFTVYKEPFPTALLTAKLDGFTMRWLDCSIKGTLDGGSRPRLIEEDRIRLDLSDEGVVFFRFDGRALAADLLAEELLKKCVV